MTADRRARADEIRAGATVRRIFGQTATHQVVDGAHKIMLLDRDARRVRSFSGATLQEAIERAEQGEENWP